MSRAKSTRCHETRQCQVLAAAATGFRKFLSGSGGCPERVLGQVGLCEDELIEATRALDLATYVRMMELAAADSRNANFGLLFGQQFLPEHLGLIGGIAIASPTIGTALQNVAALFTYHQEATHLAFKRHQDLLSLEYRITNGGILERRQDAELTLGMLVNILRHGLGPRWTPEEVHFEHPRPLDWRQHTHEFLAPVHFGQRTNALIFRNTHMDQRMPHADLRKATALSAQLARIGIGLGKPSVLDLIKGEIRSRLPDGALHVDTVADAIGLPRWTLQRRLAEYGVSFTGAVDLVRRELAHLYIRESFVSLQEIGELLGYSELSAFSRAFRRWFGLCPQKFRAAVRHLEPWG